MPRFNTLVTSGLNDRYTRTQSDNRYYTQANTNTLLNAKQDLLSNEGSLGVEIYNNKIRTIHRTNGVAAGLNLNVTDGSYNVNISSATLEADIVSNTSNITTLLNKVDYEIREIHAMQSNLVVGKVCEFPPGVFKLYSNYVYTKNETDTLLDAKQIGLTSASNFSVDVGRGNVHFDNHANDNIDGAGLTLRSSKKPSKRSYVFC